MRKGDRTPTQRKADRLTVAELHCQGRTVRDIAEELSAGRAYDISHVTVWNDLKAVQAQWRKARERAIDEHTAEELAKLSHLEREFWTAWQRSLEDKKTGSETQRQRGKEGTPYIEKSIEKSNSSGEPRFLEGALKCMERKARLLGLDAPKRTTIDGKLDVEGLENNAAWLESVQLILEALKGHPEARLAVINAVAEASGQKPLQGTEPGNGDPRKNRFS